ncbi:MAG: outer membrane beta-barrel family protein, partial [Bacteroidota bacterium]
PGVSVTANNEISIRGSTGFLVMIDGRQMQMDAATLLQVIPANQLESLEILTTPSAKYDPDGKAGIINLVSKSGKVEGWYLQANILGGLPCIEPYDNPEAALRFGGDLTFNYRKGKWDLSGALDYRRDDLSGRRVGYVNTYLDGVLTEYPSAGERSFDRYQYSGRFSASYQPKQGHEISASLYAGDRTQFRTADILYDWQQRSRIPGDQFLGTEVYWELYQQTERVIEGKELIDSLTYYNENLRVREGDFLVGGLDYRWNLSDHDQLQVAALYERTLLGGPTDNSSHAWPNLLDTLQYQFNTNDNPLEGLRLNVDHVRTVGNLSWESGYQFRYLSHPGDFVYLDRDLINDEWKENPLFTNRIELRRSIHSLYSQVRSTWKRLEYSLGLRVEAMNRQVSLDQPDTSYVYQIIQPFPSLNLQYDLQGGWIAKGGYSRRIERTTTFKMTPFPEREHNETLEQGDAELLPEFIHLAEIGLIKSWGNHSVYATGYLRQSANLINRVNTVFNDSILNRIYTNVGSGRAVGLELGANVFPAKWLRLYVGSNVYRFQIEGELFGETVNTSNWITSFNGTAEFSFGPNWRAQAGFNYLSQRVTAQGMDSRFYNPSLSLRRTFQNGKWTLGLQWLSLDLGLLQSNEQRITTQQANFFTTTNYIYEVDRVLLTLSYRLNSSDRKLRLPESEFGGREF